jgi:hypothetical protein
VVLDALLVHVNREGQSLGAPLAARKVPVGDRMHLELRSAPPPSPVKGDLYWNSTLHQPCYFDGASWVGL